jgi:hypothetical protein
MPTAKQLIGVSAVGLGLGLFAVLRQRSNSVGDTLENLLTRASFSPLLTTAQVFPISISAVYRVGDTDVIQQLQLRGGARWSEVSTVVQSLIWCVLRRPTPQAPTQLWSIRVTQGVVPLSSYRREPGQPLAGWQHVYGRQVAVDNAVPCVDPFCTNSDRPGSTSCT